jgi:hypothetical protein
MGMAGFEPAAGYVTPDGAITDWLNELAFAPVDYSLQAPVENGQATEAAGRPTSP